tara:strand:+ start:221 stop:493 length:273 start_codon:yes stop_codon:yes gene_type:complete
MELTKTKLTKEKVQQKLDGLQLWVEYEDLVLEIDLLIRLWLYRTGRMNRLSRNRQTVKKSEEVVQMMKDHLDLVLEDISQYQLDPKCEVN